MNFINTIMSFFSRKPFQKGPPAYVYVYSTGKDASNSEVNPGDQIAILRRLSSFVAKKQSPVTIIFPGRPSKKIPDGAKQDGVQARFSTSDQLDKVVKQCVEEFQKGHSVVLAADRSEFQKLADKLRIGYSLASTFAKTLEASCGPLQRETKPPAPRRQPAPQKESTQPDGTTPPSDSAPMATTPHDEHHEEPATDEQSEESDEGHDQPHTDETPSPDAPTPKTPQSSRPKLHRHVPSQKREYTDRAILDLIDPL